MWRNKADGVDGQADRRADMQRTKQRRRSGHIDGQMSRRGRTVGEQVDEQTGAGTLGGLAAQTRTSKPGGQERTGWWRGGQVDSIKHIAQRVKLPN